VPPMRNRMSVEEMRSSIRLNPFFCIFHFSNSRLIPLPEMCMNGEFLVQGRTMTCTGPASTDI